MEGFGIRGRILLYLEGLDCSVDEDPVPRTIATPGIGDAVIPDTDVLSDWVEFLSALSSLEDAGLVAVRVADVAEQPEERNAYALTEAGRERAASLRADVEAHPITVVDGDTERETALGEFVGSTRNYDLVDALIDLSDDTLYLGAETTSGFVNRTAELAALEDLLDDVDGGEGASTLVVGEPGAGKTTLLHELASRAGDRGFETAVVRCPRDVDDPYQPHRRVLAALPSVTDSPFDDARGGRVEDADALSAERVALFNDVADVLTEAATDDPLLVAIDDVQWCDEPSVDLLVHLVDHLADVPVLFVATSRPVDLAGDHPLTELVAATSTGRMDLPPFDRSSTRELVQSILDDTDVPESFLDHLHERTGGTPLFVAESVRQLRENGQIQPEYGVYPDPADADQTPSVVGDAIEGRFDALSETTTELLRFGAVIGERVPLDVLAAVTPHERPTVEDHVDLLVASQIWERSEEDAVMFRNGVVRETVLDAIPDERQRGLHETVAEELAAAEDDSMDDIARLAFHWEAAGEHERAVEYYRRAGDHAKTVYAHEVALEQYQHALSIAHDHAAAEVKPLMEAIGDVASTIGDYGTADQHFQYVREHAEDVETRQEMYYQQSEVRIAQSDYEAAIELADAGLELGDGDPTAERCRLLGQTGWGYMQQGDFAAAIDIFERELDLAAAVSERAEARALHDLGTVNMQRGDNESARDPLERAVDAWDRLGDQKQLARALNSLGAIDIHAGNLSDGAEHLERSLDILETIGESRGVATLYNNLGNVYLNRGDWEKALQRFEDGIPLSESLGDRQGVAHKLGNAAIVYLHSGDFETAAEYTTRSRSIREDINDRQGLVFADLVLGRLALRERRLADARAAADSAQDAIDALEGDTPYPELQRLRGDIERISGQPAAAIEHHQRGIEMGEQNDDPSDVAANYSSLALDRLEANDPEAALDAATTAAELLEGHDDVVNQMDTDVALGRAQLAAGRYAAAEATLSASADQASAVGATWYAALARYHLGRVYAEQGETADAESTLTDVHQCCESRGLSALLFECQRALDRLGSSPSQ